MSAEQKKTTKKVSKKRVYQVAKEFQLSNEELIDYLNTHKIKVKNHMAPIDEKAYDLINQEFQVVELESDKEPDYRKKILDKKVEEEARRELIRHEIDEVLERSKGSNLKL